MKPFDLEAAKRGEPIVYVFGKNILPFYFIGVTKNGEVVVETENGGVQFYGPKVIFMAPKKRTVWVNFYSHNQSFYHHSQNAADDSSLNSHEERIGGKAYPVEIEE